jgi:predicted enzyme related to lactoylglutathione lyase
MDFLARSGACKRSVVATCQTTKNADKNMTRIAKNLLLSAAFAGLVAGIMSLTSCATSENAKKSASSDGTMNQPAPKATGAPITYFEIAGPNGPELQKFYSSVFNWNIDEHASISAASTGGIKGGIRSDPPEKLFYLGVPDIVATLKQIQAAGGKTVIPRTVVPNVVTFAIFLDPAGNRIGLAELGSFPK